MKMNKTKPIALGGIMAATALVIMCFGGLIPIATYVCPLLCSLILYLVLSFCGKRIAWAWYAAVSVLCFFVGPDKEAAILFMLLGYYPIIKQRIDKSPARILWKLMLFNGVILIMYGLIMQVLGVNTMVMVSSGYGLWIIALFVIMGNVIFILLDKLLDIMKAKLSIRSKGRE